MPEELDPTSQLAAARSAAVSVPDHELIRLIGKGSYGEVWLGRSVLGAYRAIKIVHESSFRHRRPFEREFNGVQKFEPVSRLHDGLMDVLQVGRNDLAGYFYCVMELADDVQSGQSIDPERYAPRTLAHDLAKQKRLPIEECRRIGTGIASALDYLHSHGLIHRDVKPSNIVFVNRIPKLADIGLVAEASEARSYVGTEGFIPPEGPGTVQADLYSFGKVLYEISTGKDRNDYPELPTELGDSVQENKLFSFHKVVVKACRADPQQRYRSARAMVADLHLALPADSSAAAMRRRPWRTAVRAGLVISGLTAAAIFIASRPPGAPGKGAGNKIDPKTVSATTTTNPVSLTTGLVGYWPAEDDVIDNAGANDGKALGGLTYGPGQVGRALLFNTTNAGLKIPAAAELDVGAGNGLTLAAWIKPSDVSIRGPLFEWNDGEGAWGTHFYVDPFCRRNEVNPGALFANLEDTDHNRHSINSPGGVIASNVFQHVALTFEKHFDKDHSVATLYCNGAVVAREVFGPFTPLTSFDLHLGRRPSAEFPWDICNFKGIIDEPLIFNRALSSNEIGILYEAGAAGRSALSVPTRVPAPAGLVSWWPGENNAADIVGRNDGALMSGAAYTIGRVGSAFNFTGATNGYVEVPDSASLRLSRELTIEFWVRRTKLFGPDYVVEKGGDWTLEGLNYGVGIAPQKHRFKNVLFFAFAGGNRHSTAIADLQWHHCAVTARNGDVDPVFYVDGVRQPVTLREGDVGKGAEKILLYPSTAPLHIGGLVDPSSVYTSFGTAAIDELSIYNRVLTASEIEAIYRAGRAGKFLVPEEARVR